MEEGTKTKKTVFIGGIGDDIDEAAIYESFSTFGDILEVQIPPAQINTHNREEAQKHRGFAFVTYTSSGDAQDAIDNMDMNELRGRVLRVNLARPQKLTAAVSGNRPIWESEEWLKQYAKPLAQSGGVGSRAAIRAGASMEQEGEEKAEEARDDAMEE
ncbi:RNA-binding domain-containing protein [Fomitiporia mediterranea MF3/22]|uniref:RNA-binding domain-containing protein n=1 Tax=Fomitiporia mediterranea (strain MF3/22) TaxID=694068 RepID=UPI0004408F96|nr:RNA-binding domain-containing protein [Fomitiporia mediterranea MF3/22]EJD02314.1 RNA-binding domain-containing protein [Fomitiporia mediterranea MF3/22]